MRLLFALVIFLLAVPTASVFARSESIAAVVNQDAISMTDLQDRMHMIVVSSGLPPTQDIQDKLLPQVLNDLIEEQLKMQEAKRQKIQVSAEEIAQGFALLAQQNNLTAEQFASIMKRDGINPATVERQIKAQLGWSKVIQEVMRPRVTVTDMDIDDYAARFQGSKGKEEYRIAEIFLPVNTKEEEAATQQLAHRLVSEISSGKAPFSKIAQQFSGAAGASRGGDLGWVQQGQLQPELEQVVAGMQKDGISQPVKTTDGYHILFLRDIRTVTEESIPSREKIFTTIGIQRLERMQARELLELRTTAFIENRVRS